MDIQDGQDIKNISMGIKDLQSNKEIVKSMNINIQDLQDNT